MTILQLKQFVADNDFGYADTAGCFCAICDNDAKQTIIDVLDRCNTPKKVKSFEELRELLSHHPEFSQEIANGCDIYSCEEYDGANRINTHYIAYYS